MGSVPVTQCNWNSCLTKHSWNQQGGKTEISQTGCVIDIFKQGEARTAHRPNMCPGKQHEFAFNQEPLEQDLKRPWILTCCRIQCTSSSRSWHSSTGSCDTQLAYLSSLLSWLRLRLLGWSLLPLIALSKWQNAFLWVYVRCWGNAVSRAELDRSSNVITLVILKHC